MSTTKNPAAVALGRKGGKAKNKRKGFGSDPTAARLAALKRWAKEKETKENRG